MRTSRIAFVVAIILMLIGCNPGIDIRQVALENNSQNTVSIQVSSHHQHIRDNTYSPHVKLTNRSSETVTITRIELATSNGSYNAQQSPKSIPVVLSSGASATVAPRFGSFNMAIYKEFKNPACLRVHYRMGSNEEIAEALVTTSSRAGE